MKKKNHLGFTLLELIIVIILTSLIAVVVSKIIAQGVQAHYTAKNVLDADWQGRLGMERMARDIRAVGSNSTITTATATQLVFTNIAGTSITYSLSGTYLMRNTQILADGINALSFTYFDNTGTSTATLSLIRYVGIALTITKNNTNFSLSTAVYLRNLL